MGIKWGVLGTASIARGCTIPGMKKAQDCELYAVAGRSLEKAEKFKTEFGFQKAYEGYEALLADPEVEAVYIPLPNDLHFEWSMKAMRAGKHVLCEKPLVTDAGQAEELFKEARKQGVHLIEAFAYLNSPYVRALEDELASGSIGDIDYIESAFVVQDCDPADIRMRRETFGGAFYDLGCYPLSLIEKLLGKLPTNAVAMAEYTKEHIDIYSAALLSYPGGVRAAINCGMVLGPKPVRMDRLYIHGNKGTIKSFVEFNQAGDLSFTVSGETEKIVKVSARDNYALEVEQMNRCIMKGETPVVTPEFSVMNAKAMDMVLRAMGY